MKRVLLLFLFSSAVFAQNQNISGGFVFEGEPYMILDPSNPQHIVVAWIGYVFGQPAGIKTKVSTNGGNSWSSSPIILPHGSPNHKSADPSMDYDNTGNLWACYVDYRESPDSGGIYVVRSTDGGFTWDSFSKAMDGYDDGMKKPIDRPWLTINPINNHFYISSKPAPWVPAPNRPYLSLSTNMGATWEPWRYIDTTNYLVGNVIQAPMAAIDVGNDGVVHCIYPTYETSQNFLPGYICASSSNSGANFSYAPAVYAATGSGDTLAKLGGSLAVDPSDPDHLVFVVPFRPVGADYNIYAIESTNGGLNWTDTMRVNDDLTGKMQDMAWCNFDTDGDLVVGWRDRRNGSGTGYATSSDIWGAVKWKDSTDFSANFRIADSLANYNAVLSLNGNDFMNTAMHNDTLYAVWGDVRTGILNIYFAKKSLLTGSMSIELVSSEEYPEITLYPNPATDVLNVSTPKDMDIIAINIYDLTGKCILKQLNGNLSIPISHLNAGNYIVQVETSKSKYSLSFIKK